MTKIRRYHICENIKNCPIYRNYVKETKDDRINIINYSDIRGFSCLALDVLEDCTTEGGIIFNEEIKKRIKEIGVEKNIGVRETQCSKITLLNLLL